MTRAQHYVFFFPSFVSDVSLDLDFGGMKKKKKKKKAFDMDDITESLPVSGIVNICKLAF